MPLPAAANPLAEGIEAAKSGVLGDEEGASGPFGIAGSAGGGTAVTAHSVVGGSGRIKLDDEVVELRHFDVVRVAPQVVRAFEAGPEGLEILAVGGRKPEDGDGVRDPGRWPAP